MQDKSRRATAVWLVMVGIILGIVLLSGAVATQTAVILLGAYLLMAALGMGVFTSNAFRERLPGAASRKEASRGRWTPGQRRRRQRTSSAAEKATDRASRLPAYLDQFDLLDVGVIASAIGRDGMRLKRGGVTLDDQGIQPYVVVQADPSWNNERATAIFEVLDPAGEVRFRHEQDIYLREGQNNILSDHRLPLGDNAPDGAAPGLWELRTSLAGSVVALHTFSMGPSTEQRRREIQAALQRRNMQQRQDRLRESDDTPPADFDDDSPVSLEDLLRGGER